MYKKLLVPLDGSATAQLALKHAEALAKLSGSSIILLSIVEEMHYSNGYERPKVYTEQVRPHFLATARALLEKAAKPLRDGGLSVAAHVVESGNHRVSELIVQQAKDEHCDLIILGTHGRRGIDRLLLGSDAEQVAARMLRLVREGVVEAVDGSLAKVEADSICVHGDSPDAVAMARAVRRVLADAGVTLAPFV